MTKPILMKKTLYLTLFIFCKLSIYSQSLQFVKNGTNNPIKMNDTVSINAEGHDLILSVKNTTNAPVDTKFKMELVYSSNINCQVFDFLHFCDISSCYTTGVKESVVEATLNENTMGRIEIAIDPGIYPGTYTLKYTLFNVANPSNDNAYCYVTYIVKPSSNINNINYKNFALGNISPNPISSNAYIDYNFASEPQNAVIQIYNMLGSFIKEVKLIGKEGKATIDAEGLSNGVYSYSLFVDNKQISTKEFIIAKE